MIEKRVQESFNVHMDRSLKIYEESTLSIWLTQSYGRTRHMTSRTRLLIRSLSYFSLWRHVEKDWRTGFLANCRTISIHHTQHKRAFKIILVSWNSYYPSVFCQGCPVPQCSNVDPLDPVSTMLVVTYVQPNSAVVNIRNTKHISASHHNSGVVENPVLCQVKPVSTHAAFNQFHKSFGFSNSCPLLINSDSISIKATEIFSRN